MLELSWPADMGLLAQNIDSITSRQLPIDELKELAKGLPWQVAPTDAGNDVHNRSVPRAKKAKDPSASVPKASSETTKCPLAAWQLIYVVYTYTAAELESVCAPRHHTPLYKYLASQPSNTELSTGRKAPNRILTPAESFQAMSPPGMDAILLSIYTE